MENTLPTAAALVARADTMTFNERKRMLHDLGSTHHRDPGFPGLLADLTAHSGYGAGMSLDLARSGADHLETLLRHPDPDTAAEAIRIAASSPGHGPAIEAALPDQSKAVRTVAYAALRKYRDVALADRLLPVVKERYGAEEAASLLAACSTDTIAAELPALAPYVTSWSTFAKRHPATFTAYARTALAERSPAQWADWWQRHLNALTAAIARAPLAWLDLLERHPAAITDRAVLAAIPILLAADADRTWAYLLDQRRERLLASVLTRHSLLRRLATEAPERVAKILRHHPSALPNLLRYTAPSKRLALLDAVRTAGVHVDDEPLLGLLPHTARAEAARRLHTERRVAGDPARRDFVRAHLPFEEIRDDLLEATRRSDTDSRAQAYGHLVRAAALRRDPATVTDLFTLLDRAAKDQGVVHDKIFLGLKQIRPQDWTADALAALEAFSETCMASPARSANSVLKILDLSGHLILAGLSAQRPELVAHGERRIDRVFTEMNGWALGNVLARLPRPTVLGIVRRVAPALVAQAEVDEYNGAIVLARTLGRHLGEAPELEPVLRSGLRSKSASVVSTCLDLLLRITPGRYERIAELASAAPSRPELFPALAVFRCDLLPAWFAAIGEPSPDALRQVCQRWPLAILAQWPPAVRAAYRDVLLRIATDDRRKDYSRADALRVLTHVPDLPLETLAPFLNGDDRQLRAVAVSALHQVTPVEAAWEALPAHLEGDNAAVAAAAMERLAHRSRPETIVAFAARLLDSPKVTVRKQTVRVLARYRVPGAAEILPRLWADPNLHPSVREATAAVAAERLTEPWAQALVEDTARFGPDVRAVVLALDPDQVPAPFAARYIDLLTTAAADDDPRLQVAGSDGLARWAGYSDAAADALVDLAADLDSGDVWAAAMNALCALVATGGDSAPLLRAADRLNTQADGQPNAEEDRDLPVRQRLERIVTSLAPLYGRRRLPPDLVAVITDRLPVDLGTRLLARTIDWNADPDTLRALAARIQDPLEAKLIGDALDERMTYETVADPLAFATALADLDDTHAAIIAATVIDTAASPTDWPDPARDLVRRLRAHRSTMVRTLALTAYTTDEYLGASWHA